MVIAALQLKVNKSKCETIAKGIKHKRGVKIIYMIEVNTMNKTATTVLI